MKKLFSIILTITMIMTCALSTFTVAPVSATDVSLDITSLEKVFGFIDTSMSDSANERIEAYYILANYVQNDTGIDTLIGVLDGTITPIPDDLKKSLGNFESSKDEIIFMLSLIKGLDDERVEEGIEEFEAIRERTEAKGGVEEPYVTCQEDLEYFYTLLVSQTGRDKLMVHNVGPNAIVSLIEKFSGYVMLTDDVVGGEDFALDWVADEYKDSALSYIDSINGNAVSSTEDIFEAIIETANDYYSADEKAAIKAVFGEIELYNPLREATPTPSPQKPDKDRPSSGGIASGIVIETPAPTEEPDEEILEEVDSHNTIAQPAKGSVLFNDMDGHWAENYVSDLAEKGIFKGYETGNFEPDWGITREELAVVLVRVLDLESQLGTAPLVGYHDVAEISEWARESVALTTKLGIYEGYDDGYYRPHKIITREELCTIIIRSMENSGNKVYLNYTDRATFPDWSTPFIGKASYHGIVSGYPDGEFRPRQNVTRAEAGKMIYNYMQIR